MKTQPRLRLCLLFLAVAAVLGGAATGGFAQGAETPSAGKDGRAATTPSPAYDLEIKDSLLIWNGAKRKDNASQVQANLQNVVDLLRELHPEANFAVSPGLAGIVIADLKMRTSSAEEKLEAIRIASGSEFLWRNAQVTSIDPTTGLPATPAVPGNAPSPALYVMDTVPATTKPGLQVEAFHLGEHFTYVYGSAALVTNKATGQRLIAEQMEQIEHMALETVRAYEVLSMTANNSKAKSLRTPSIKFHTGANLAIIIGEPEAVAIVAKVIGALPGAKRSVAPDAPGYGDQRIDEAIKKFQRQGALLGAPR